MSLRTQLYTDQNLLWPKSGRHILAQFDANSVYVYQAYRPSIAQFAVEHQKFGRDFSFNRMSWIKPNFLWMMYRAGWATKEGQERILAIRLPRAFFDGVLAKAVASTFIPGRFATREEWQAAVQTSDVRLQWDPDHDPAGTALERRAIQLGLRGSVLREFGQEKLLSIEDITDFVAEQRQYISGDLAKLVTPEERVYRPADPAVSAAVGLDVL